MKLFKSITLTVTAVAILAACGGREARHYAVTNPTDSQMDCNGISREWAANEDLIGATAQTNSNKTGANVAAVAVGAVIFLPALFFMDLKGAEKAELIALRARQKNIQIMNSQKHCKPLASKLGSFYTEWDQANGG
jgi:hypothetical protein